jgi:hypothetical protein
MLTVLFVHGTGVRTEEFNHTLSAITACFGNLANIEIAGCEWGKAHGARTARLSIPDYQQVKALDPEGVFEPIDMWAQLLADPFIEIELFARIGDENEPLFGDHKTLAACEADTLSAITGATTPPSLQQHLGRDTVEQAVATVFAYSETERAWGMALASEADLGDALTVGAGMLARAVVALSMAKRFGQGFPVMPGEQRDIIVDWLASAMSSNSQRKGLAADAFAAVMAPVRKLGNGTLLLGAWLGTAALKHYRSGISDTASLRAGDILLYQSRGDAIRQFIAAQVRTYSHPVLLLGHSLGGIACVDLLATIEGLPVAGLVTVGSQAPYLYELGALSSMLPDTALPEHFPAWLNFYDRNDMLSYLAKPVFGAKVVADVEIKSNQPFPIAHSAYWTDPVLGARLRQFASELSI